MAGSSFKVSRNWSVRALSPNGDPDLHQANIAKKVWIGEEPFSTFEHLIIRALHFD
jgi:hypothetical protein